LVLVLRPPADAVCAGHSHEAQAESQREGNCGNDKDARLGEAAGFLVSGKQHVALHAQVWEAAGFLVPKERACCGTSLLSTSSRT